MKSQLISTDISNTAFTRLRRGQKNVDVADLPEMLQRKVRAQVAGGGADSLLSRQFNPFIQRMSLEEPRSWEERVRWKRYFYQTDPLINAAIQVHCLPAGEPVITPEGVKAIEAVTVDDQVLSASGTWQSVLGTDSHEFEGDMYTITVLGVPDFHCTDEHPVLVRGSHIVKTSRTGKDGKIHWDSERKEPTGEAVWKKASELNVGDYVLVPKLHLKAKNALPIFDLAPYTDGVKQSGGHYRVNEKTLSTGHHLMPRFVALTPELANVLGWYVAEGSSGKAFSLSHDESKEAQEISDKLVGIFGRGPSIAVQTDKRNGSQNTAINFSYAPFNRWMKSVCGDGSHNKKIPSFIFESEDEAIIKAFLSGYYDGDGCYREWDRHAITVSKTLAYQIQLLLGRLDIFAKVKCYKHTKTRGNQYVIIVSKREWATKFLNQPDPHKKKHFGLVFQDSEYSYCPIRKIKKTKTHCRVYDIHTADNSFATPFLVHNSQFPLSNLHIQHEDEEIREFFDDMLDELDFFEFLVDFNTEFNITGEVIPYGVFDNDKNPGIWKGFILINPVNATIEGSEFAQGAHKDVVILRLDPKLRRIVDNPRDPVLGPLCEKLSPDIVQAIRTGQGLRLDPVQVSRLRRPGSYFSRRSASMIDCVFRDLMYREKLRCHDDQTECLTRSGWKKYDQLSTEDEIGTVNPQTGFLEYQVPSDINITDYSGPMVKFKNHKRLDMLVTPNHRMWFTKRSDICRTDRFTPDKWEFVDAPNVKQRSRFMAAVSGFIGKKPKPTITIGDKTYDFMDYMRIAAYYTSEGYAEVNPCLARRAVNCKIAVHQNASSKHFSEMKELFAKYEWLHSVSADGRGSWYLHDTNHTRHFGDLFGYGCETKKIPQDLKNLTVDFLEEFLRCIVNGDGTRRTRYEKTKATSTSYGTVSLRLANDIQELALKCGYSPLLGGFKPGKLSKLYCYTVAWSNNKQSSRSFPSVTPDNSKTTVEYSGKVWCVTVPNGLVITRRNGRVVTSSNSAQYAIADRHITPREFYFIGDENNVADQAELDNFRAALASSWTDVNSAIVYHHAVRVQIEGSSGKILPIWPEMEATDKRIMVGMEINESMIMGDSSSFATSVVGYDVVISRWLAQRQRIEKWMRRNVFGPICKIHKMYVPENKIKSSKYRQQAGLPRPLWIPDVRWEKQHLRDESARLDLLTKLVVSKQIPIEMLYDLLELETKTVEDMVDKEIERQATRKKKLVERLTKLQLLQFADFGAQKDDGSGGGGGMTMPPGMDGGGGGALPSSALGGGDAGGPPGGDMPDVAGQDMDSPSAGLANGLPGGPQAVTGASPAAGGTNPQPGANSVL